MAHSGKTITFATDLLPNENNTYNLGSSSLKWKIFGSLTGAASLLTTSNLGSATKPIYLVAGAATECNDYAGGTAITLNGTSKAANTASFYAPTGSGTASQLLVSGGSNTAPSWNTTHILPSTGGWLATGGDGSSTGVGDAYTPIYLNTSGILTVVTPMLQVAFTIAANTYGVSLAHTAFTTSSYVTNIIIETGIENLTAPLSWSSETTGTITLNSAKLTSGQITGYILVSRGGGLTATATNITSNT